ncbi:tetraacyldisaccharide 4'-kinase [Flavobacteriaceae bacterium]|nr:tetraacyldisaccharide 4'-kinase [Flavobacteriaceae bacterium]
MSLFRIIFYPFSLLYFVLTSLRNRMFDIGLLKSKSFDIPLVGIGNLSSGGTGKTPMVEYIFDNFSNNFNLSLLSRGYKKNRSGYIKASENSSASSIGDEPYQIFRKFNNIKVAVDENRVRGVENLINEEPKLQAIILDDCFQHRYVSLKLNILLTTYTNPFFKDYLLPYGNLRESRNGFQRANIIVVTKCPAALKATEMDEFRSSLKLETNQSLFFTSVQYNNILKGKRNIPVKELLGSKVLLITGIANNLSILKYLKHNEIEFEHLNFADHHNYSSNDINKIEKKYCDYNIITTEKDYVKLSDFEIKNNLYYLEIKTNFLQDEDLFKNIISKTLSN